MQLVRICLHTRKSQSPVFCKHTQSPARMLIYDTGIGRDSGNGVSGGDDRQPRGR